MDDRLNAVAVAGVALDDFTEAPVAVKLRWLLRRFPNLRTSDLSFRVLDYGCGSATLLRLMAEAGITATLMGCDITPVKLHEAMQRWPRSLRPPELHCCASLRTSLEDRSVDLLILNVMLHQVPMRSRSAVYGEARRLLRPGGQLVVFEHNPLTRYVNDPSSDLVHSSDLRIALRAFGFRDIHTEYLMFLPPRLTMIPVERAVRWLPLGAQYSVVARRSDHALWRNPAVA